MMPELCRPHQPLYIRCLEDFYRKVTRVAR